MTSTISRQRVWVGLLAERRDYADSGPLQRTPVCWSSQRRQKHVSRLQEWSRLSRGSAKQPRRLKRERCKSQNSRHHCAEVPRSGSNGTAASKTKWAARSVSHSLCSAELAVHHGWAWACAQAQ